MSEALLALLALGALAVGSKKKSASAVSGNVTLTPGNYLLRFKSAKPQTADLNVVWSMPQALMGGTGLNCRFDSLQVDRSDPNIWWFTALCTYAGPAKTITLLPEMTLVHI